MVRGIHTKNRHKQKGQWHYFPGGAPGRCQGITKAGETCVKWATEVDGGKILCSDHSPEYQARYLKTRLEQKGDLLPAQWYTLTQALAKLGIEEEIKRPARYLRRSPTE